MSGEWERKSDTVWTYRLAGAASMRSLRSPSSD